MKGDILFEKMTNLRDDTVADAALPDGPAVGGFRTRMRALSHALNSGWGVACICILVAVAALAGMIAWGRMGAAGPGVASDPGTRFAFSYALTPEDGVVSTGATFTLQATVENLGPDFTYEGSSSDYAPYACFRYAEDPSVILNGAYPHAEDWGFFVVTTGETGQAPYVFSVPADAAAGEYDLVLSYGDCEAVYPAALLITPAGERFILGHEGHATSGLWQAGTSVFLTAWVENAGPTFTFEGSSSGFKPAAVLRHAESGYAVEGLTDSTTDFRTVTVPNGTRGRGVYEFFFPEDAPGGVYDLVLTYGECSRVFNGVGTVRVDEEDSTGSFSFSYVMEGFAIPGDILQAEARVVNEGEPFVFTGSSGGFCPDAVLRHEDSDYVIRGDISLTDDEVEFTVPTGEVGTAYVEFWIPTDAPTGEYRLVLSFGTDEVSFHGALTLAVP